MDDSFLIEVVSRNDFFDDLLFYLLAQSFQRNLQIKILIKKSYQYVVIGHGVMGYNHQDSS